MRHIVAAVGRWLMEVVLGLWADLVVDGQQDAGLQEERDRRFMLDARIETIQDDLQDKLESEFPDVPIQVESRNGILFIDIAGQTIPEFIGEGYFSGFRVVVEG